MPKDDLLTPGKTSALRSSLPKLTVGKGLSRSHHGPAEVRGMEVLGDLVLIAESPMCVVGVLSFGSSAGGVNPPSGTLAEASYSELRVRR